MAAELRHGSWCPACHERIRRGQRTGRALVPGQGFQTVHQSCMAYRGRVVAEVPVRASYLLPRASGLPEREKQRNRC